MKMSNRSILFVCTGNICRSPMAQGLCERLAEERGWTGILTCDSAGTHGYRDGSPPHPLAIEAMADVGIDISAQRCRVVEAGDFSRFDHIVAMDRDNLSYLQYVCPPSCEDRLRLLMSYADGSKEDEIPDPFGDRLTEFEEVRILIDSGVRCLLDALASGEQGFSVRDK